MAHPRPDEAEHDEFDDDGTGQQHEGGQGVGGIAEDEFDEDGNTIPGYQTSVPLAATISASDKASRRLTNCKFKARLAGAIHFAELTGSLTYEL